MKRLYFFTIILLMAIACDSPNRGNNSANDNEQGENTANGDNDYSRWDADNNNFIDNSEFKSAFTTSPYYGKWNTNSNDFIDKEEFYQGYIKMIDQNKDGALNQEEWQQGIKSYFGTDGEEDYGEFSEWDQNGDGTVDADEFSQHMDQTKLFKDWDQNGDDKLHEEEFAEKTFAMWDTDGNGMIEAEEYTEWNNKTGEGI